MESAARLLLLPLLAGCASAEYKAPLPTLPAVTYRPAAISKPPVPDTLPDLPPEDPVKAVAQANKSGIVKPRREWFKGSAYMPPYHPNHDYLVYVPFGRLTTFEFSEGEKPQGAGAVCSDTSGEILAPSLSSMGVEPDVRWVFQVKVTMAPPFPNQDCTISTTRGIYSIIIQGTANTHTKRVRWSDPHGLLSESDPDADPLCDPKDTAYLIDGDPGAFGLRPGDISNDGVHTCIRFPQSAGFDYPAVWLIEGDHERPASPSTINGAYMIDGVPPVIELRTDTAKLRLERVPQ